MTVQTPPIIEPVAEFPALGDANFNAKAFNWATNERTKVAPQFAATAVNVAANAAFAQGQALSATSSASAAADRASAAAASAVAAREAELSAIAFAQQAGLATDVPIIILQPRRITVSQAIPNGFNAHTVGPFEVDPDVTVQGLGNATWTGL